MSAPTHTPGPWHVYPTLERNKHAVVLCGTTPIAKVHNHYRNVWANARLIAEAPDLHNAIRKLADEASALLTVHEQAIREDSGNSNVVALLDRINEARDSIAKASGEEGGDQ